jgi:hypothetical protein
MDRRTLSDNTRPRPLTVEPRRDGGPGIALKTGGRIIVMDEMELAGLIDYTNEMADAEPTDAGRTAVTPAKARMLVYPIKRAD